MVVGMNYNGCDETLDTDFSLLKFTRSSGLRLRVRSQRTNDPDYLSPLTNVNIIKG